MNSLHEVRKALVRVCRLLDVREYVGGRDGNVSARVSATTIVVTPAGLRKGDVSLDDLLLVNRKGEPIEGKGRPSTEIGMHLRIYDRRPDVAAVVHAHPPAATGFAATGRGITGCVLPETIVGLGAVPVVPYALPGTPDVADALDPFLASHDALLLENHGAVTMGPDLELAYQRMETVEQAARILLAARILGGERALPPEEVRRLVESRPRYGVREGLASCDPVTSSPKGGGKNTSSGVQNEDALAEVIVERVLKRLREREKG